MNINPMKRICVGCGNEHEIDDDDFDEEDESDPSHIIA